MTSKSSPASSMRRRSTSPRSRPRPRSRAHVRVDFELRGCPIDKRQLLEVLTAFLHGRRPEIPSTSVCTECKRRGNVCVMVAHGTPCLGPVTHAGLRSALPDLQPRLLRLLRPHGDAEHDLADAAAEGARHGRTAASSASSAPSTRTRPSSGRHRPVAERRTIRTDYLARVEGEGAMSVRLRDGVVEDVELRIFEPPRFFEALLRGRSFLESPDITARICGICPVAYQMSAVQAMEDLCGVAVPEPIRAAAPDPLLRRVDREPRAARLHAPRSRLPRLRRRGRVGAGRSGGRRTRARAEEDRERGDER